MIDALVEAAQRAARDATLASRNPQRDDHCRPGRSDQANHFVSS
jgi:hypothetical protein